MDKQIFLGERLQEALEFRVKKMTELADETGISKQSLSLYAHNNNTPPYENVVKIARALNFPYDFFMNENACTVVTGNTYFRSQATATKRNRKSQKIKLEYVAKLYGILLDYVNFPELNLPDTSDLYLPDDVLDVDSDEAVKSIEELAMKVRKWWGLGNGPIDNLQYILESNGIIVTGFRDVDTHIDAFSQQITVNDKKIFIIALAIGNKPIERLRFDMAHELGHILMHVWGENNEDVSRDEFNAREKQANMFASALLLPRETFVRSVSAYPSDVDFYKSLKKKWKVSIQAMMYRTRQIGIISANQFQYMMRIVSKNGWRTKEPGDVPGQLKDTIFQGAIDLLFDGGYLSRNELVREFAQNGVILAQDDLENLMCLRKGTLDQEAKVVPFLTIKH